MLGADARASSAECSKCRRRPLLHAEAKLDVSMHSGRRDEEELAPTESQAGRSLFLLSWDRSRPESLRISVPLPGTGGMSGRGKSRVRIATVRQAGHFHLCLPLGPLGTQSRTPAFGGPPAGEQRV